MDEQERQYREHEARALARGQCPASGLFECECLNGPCDCFVRHDERCAGCALSRAVWANTAVFS